MALDKGEGFAGKVTSITQARKERLDKSSIAYGRRQTDDPDGPNLQASLETAENRPNVRAVSNARATGRKFNKEKVDKIKNLLERGEYQIDSLKVADLFIEHERHS